MGLSDRPFAPNWKQNKSVYKHTPDAIVYVNGAARLESCPTCKSQIEIQKYVTSISVDASTDPISTAGISLSVPKHASDVFGTDGNWLLQVGLEVVIKFRGYFPQSGLTDDYDGQPLSQVQMYPYYQVFRGVVTECSHSFSGGFYTAQISCSNILHFWQYLYLSTNGAVFGPRPDNSGVYLDLSGHSFNGLSPYSIIYTLVRTGFGAAFGVEYKLSNNSNINTDGGVLFKHAQEQFAARWERHSGNLRMYGVDGSLYSMFEQSYLGLFQSGGRKVSSIVKSMGGKLNLPTRNIDNTQSFQETMRKLGYDRSSTVASETVSNGRNYKIDILAMMAFAMDLGTLAQVNYFSSEMLSKLEIANAVIAITGFEFYQDVDGDLVFKPPFYNLDTRDDPYYVIEDRDLISIDESSREPEATMIKGSGNYFGIKGTPGSDDWIGVGSTYVDYRLVAQFGWREGGAFDTTYLSDPRAIFVSAINRLDLANLGMNTAQIKIPLRPELRAGYPIYIRSLDCFYYIKSLSHSFSFGEECSTSISGVARRRKWFPPIDPPKDGKFPRINDIKLDRPGEYPAHPIYVNSKDVGDGQLEGEVKAIGFPNVVMALDADKLDLGSVPLPSLQNADLQKVINSNPGVLERSEDGYRLRSDNEETSARPYSENELLEIFTNIRQKLISGTGTGKLVSPNVPSQLVDIFQNSPLGNNSAIRSDRELTSYISLQVNLKALFAPGNEVRGQYRYYSSSHPLPEFQGPKTISFEDNTITSSPATGEYIKDKSIPTLVEKEDGVGLVNSVPERGVRIAVYNDLSGSTFANVQTGDVRQVSFAPHFNNLATTQEIAENALSFASGLGIGSDKIEKAMVAQMSSIALTLQPNQVISNRFREAYNTMNSYFSVLYEAFVGVLPELSNTTITGPAKSPLSNQAKVPYSLAKSSLSDLNGMLSANGINGSKTVTDVYTNKDKLGVNAISSKLAKPLAKLVSEFLNSAKELAKNSGNSSVIEILFKAKSTFERDLDISGSIPAGTKKTKVKANSSKKFYTIVFPVSDKNGYEVYGGMPYGRNMNLSTHYEVYDGVEAQARPESLFNNERSLLIITTRGYDAVNSFKGINEQERAILASVGINQSGDLEKIVQTTKNSKGQVLARNSPISSTDAYQSVSGAEAARGLANIDINSQSQCKCKGVDAAFLMELYKDQEKVMSEGEMVEYLLGQNREVGVVWSQSKNAIAGVSAEPVNYNKQLEKLRSLDQKLNNISTIINDE